MELVTNRIGGDAAECEDRRRRWMAYNPLFKNSYVDVDMF
jgi:hypothetical protein